MAVGWALLLTHRTVDEHGRDGRLIPERGTEGALLVFPLGNASVDQVVAGLFSSSDTVHHRLLQPVKELIGGLTTRRLRQSDPPGG